jgi:hypothetical protein
MSRFNRFASKEYCELRDAIRTYANTEQRPGESIKTVVADALSDYFRESRKNSLGLDAQAEPACIGRIVADWDECHHRIGSPKAAGRIPCKPPVSDHPYLWLSDGDAVLFSLHLYQLTRDKIGEIFLFAQKWGLEMDISPCSHYYPNKTVNVVLYSSEWFGENSRGDPVEVKA